MIQEKILSVIYSGLNMVGTIWAVYSVIYMTPESVYESLTIGGVTSADKGLIRQKKDTLYGIALIIVGFFGQTILTFVGTPNWIYFVLYLIGTAILVYVTIKVVDSIYCRFIERYMKIKEHKVNNG
jgi:hypothetical protein